MAQPIEDIIMKSIVELFKGDAVKFFGIDNRVVEVVTLSADARTELLHIHVQRNINDWILILDDGSYLHIEFQSDYDSQDLVRFMISDATLYFKVRKRIRTIVVYTADIKSTATTLDAGVFQYKVEPFYMSELNGDDRYEALRVKVDAGERLSKQDLMSIVFLPMMQSDVDKVTRFERSINLSKEVPVKDEQVQIQAMLQLLAEKFVKDPAMLKRLKEMISVGLIAEMIRQDAVRDNSVEIAKNLLRKGSTVEFVSEVTGLDIPTVLTLQSKLDNV